MIKMIIMLVCLLSLQTFASKSSAQEKVSLNLKTNTLKKVFKSIEHQTKLRFVYNDEMLPTESNISIQVQNKNWEDALSMVLKNTKLNYKLLDDNLVVITNDASPKAIYQGAISGKVVDQRNEPLIGVSIHVEGTNIGAVTNEAGEYVIEGVPNTATLVFSYIGFTTQEIAVDSRSRIDVVLEENATKLEEVVVTALGITREAKSLTYTTQKVNPATLTEVRDPSNILNSLQGKVANALIIQSSEGVGGPAKIILRGNRSLTTNSSALIVVDGIPSSVTGVNPENIESMTVLNGATGAALYGPDAGGGVILVTTKKGSKSGLTINFNSGVVAETPFALPRVQNIYGQGGGTGAIDPSVGANWGPKMEGQMYTDYFGNQSEYSPQPDNIRDFFRTGITFNNAISVSAGSDKVQTYMSYVNNSVEGIIPNNNLTSHIVNLRITNQVSKKLSTDAKITYHRRQIKAIPRYGESNAPVFDIYQIPRNVTTAMAEHYQDINSLGVPVVAPWPSTSEGVYSNPYWEVNNDRNDQLNDNVVGFLKAEYKFADWLSVRGSANIDYYSQTNDWRINEGTVSWATKAGGKYELINTHYLQQWFDLMVEGSNKIGKDLKVNYHLGSIYRDNNSNITTNTADGLKVANNFRIDMATTPVSVQSGQQIQTQSVFGVANISLKDYLFVEGTLRNDWDTRLPYPHNYQYYSFGLSGILSDMFVLPAGIGYLKAFASYAEVGNGGQFGLLSTTYKLVPGSGNGYLERELILPFPDLKPEIVQTIEAGIETRLLQNRLGVSLTYYKSNAKNQLFKLPISSASGFTTQYINAGNVQNQGIEAVINVTPLRNTKFGWDVSFNFGANRNKVIELTDEITTFPQGFVNRGGQPQVRAGGSFGDIYAKTWLKDDNGQYIVDADGRPMTSDRAGEPESLVGNFQPKARLGLSNSFTYGNFALRVLVDGRVGGIIISGTEMNLSFNGIPEATAEHREGGWSLGGVDNEGNPVTEEITAQQFWQTVSSHRNGAGEFFLYDATNFRVRELSLGYNLPIKAKFIKSARLSAVGRNLFWIYRGSSKLDIPGLGKRKMWMDPDMGGAGNNQAGNEYGLMPTTRTLGLNLQLTF